MEDDAFNTWTAATPASPSARPSPCSSTSRPPPGSVSAHHNGRRTTTAISPHEQASPRMTRDEGMFIRVVPARQARRNASAAPP
jgi:hypothetical protein